MLVLLPPSETKTADGTGPPLTWHRLSFEQLNPNRQRLADALIALSGEPESARHTLGLSPRQSGEVERNAMLYTAPTAPALARYTGVLYEALGYPDLDQAQRRRAHERLVVGSALFGLLGGADPIPAYRLSAGSKLPGIGGLGAFWRPALRQVLEQLPDAPPQLLVDLRSGAYAGLGAASGGIGVRVLSVAADGSRSVISHHNKAYKGALARRLAIAAHEPATLADVAELAATDGVDVELPHPHGLDLLVRR